jgi:methyl-accepting chemotaxis protein
MKLKSKIAIMVGIILIVSVVFLGAFAIINLNTNGQTAIEDLENVMYDQYDQNIEYQVSIVITQLNGVMKHIEDGLLTEAEGKKVAASIIRDARYGESGYFWADDFEGNNVVLLGREDVEGSNRLDLEDTQGLMIIKEMIKIADEDGRGFIDYYFPRPGEDEAKRKRGFVRHFEGFDWVVGTGNYVDDIEV